MDYRGQIERGLEDCRGPVFGDTEEWRTECITERREWRLLQLSIEGFTKQPPFSPSSILCLPPLSPQLRLVWMEGAVQSEEMPTFANPPLILGDHHWAGRGDGGGSTGWSGCPCTVCRMSQLEKKPLRLKGSQCPATSSPRRRHCKAGSGVQGRDLQLLECPLPGEYICLWGNEGSTLSPHSD